MKADWLPQVEAIKARTDLLASRVVVVEHQLAAHRHDAAGYHVIAGDKLLGTSLTAAAATRVAAAHDKNHPDQTRAKVHEGDTPKGGKRLYDYRPDALTSAEKAHGKLSKKAETEVGKGHAEREEMPGDVFLEPGSRKYPVKEKRDGKWVYTRDLLLAAARRARMQGKDDLASKADKIRNREFEGQERKDASPVNKYRITFKTFDGGTVRKETVAETEAIARAQMRNKVMGKISKIELIGRADATYKPKGGSWDGLYSKVLRRTRDIEGAAATKIMEPG